MGDVYLSVRKGPGGFNKLLVIKELRPALASDADFLSMFLEEARLAARLNHPNVVQTYEVGCDGGRYFIAMEYLDGQPFQRVIAELFRTRKEVPLGLAVSILDEVLSGLSYAHTLTDYDGKPLSVIHRDITPQNIFVTYDGQVKIVDFGIAKAMDSAIETRTGSFKGKLGYVAPEQVAGDTVDDRADIFSVGVILWEILARRRIWRGISQVAIINCLLKGEIPSITDIRPDVPSALVAIVNKAIAQKPDDRYATAAELSAALVAYLDESGEPHLRQRDIGKAVSTLLSKQREGAATVLNEEILKRLKDGNCNSIIPNLIQRSHPPSHAGGQTTKPCNNVSPIVWTSVSEIQSAPRILEDDDTVNYRIPRSGNVKGKPGRYGVFVGIGMIALVLVTVLLFREFTVDSKRSVYSKLDFQSGDLEINAAPISGGTAASHLVDGNKVLVELSGDIETDAVLESDQEFLLKFTTYVRPGATLTIHPGATIRGDKATRGTLVVEPGGKIIAEGTPEYPIVFTSNQPSNQRRPGDWGGIIIMGEAPTNLRGENGEAVLGQVEGIVKRGEYGGNNPDDDSGVMRYIRIEYSGVEIAPNNEINGLTLAGVGRGTQIDHIQVRFTTDDCYEFFGGTVNASHLVCHATGDDGFDWDLGYTGHLQYLVFVSDPNVKTSINGFEGDNDPDGTLNTPISEPYIYNATLVGARGRKSSESYGMLFKGATRAHVANVLVTGFTAGIDVRDPLTQVDIESSIFFGNVIHEIAFPEQEKIRRGPNADDDGSIDERALVLDPARGNHIRDPKLGPSAGSDTPPIKPKSLLSSTSTPPNNGFFDTSAAFVGAFRDTRDNWDKPWVVWNDE